MSNQLTLDVLTQAVAGTTAAIRCRTRLQPDGGDGGKVFPPTYAGGVYAVEDRRIDGKVVRCVLLDSVQSQANRMEEVLQDAFLPNWRELPTDGDDPQCDLPVLAVHVENHGWVTSLTAPHRIHDAILRDSNLNGTRFRDSDIGQAIVNSRVWNATAFYRYCPTSLLFGTWDSTAGEGLDSAKIPRAVVSEIIGVDITSGVRTGSRIDPLGIERGAAVVYRRGDDWTLNEAEADKDARSNAIRYGKGSKSGKPSAINHGNITPDLARFGDRREIQNQHLDQLADVLRDDPVSLSYELQARNGELRHQVRAESRSVPIKPHAVKPGGVTMDYALHTWTLSLTQLRRLRFPVDRKHDEEWNNAARTVLAALGLYALALQQERGYWLRSRCELIPAKAFVLEIVGGSEPCPHTLSSEEDKGPAQYVYEKLLQPACAKAKEAFREVKKREDAVAETNGSDTGQDLPRLPDPGWEQHVVRLTPTQQLADLVQRSDAQRPDADDENVEEAVDVGPES